MTQNRVSQGALDGSRACWAIFRRNAHATADQLQQLASSLTRLAALVRRVESANVPAVGSGILGIGVDAALERVELLINQAAFAITGRPPGAADTSSPNDDNQRSLDEGGRDEK